MKNSLTALVALLVCGVATQAAPIVETKPLDQQIKVSKSEFSAAVHYNGPDISVQVQPDDTLLVKLVILKDQKTNALTWAVVLQAEYYLQWRFYEGVTLVGGKTIKAEDQRRILGPCSSRSCSFLESGVVYLDADDVRSGLANGLKMRWNAQAYGAFVVELPRVYFAAMAARAAGPDVLVPSVPAVATNATVRTQTPAAAPVQPIVAAQNGTSSYAVEHLPEIQACHPTPTAFLSAKGAGFESYTVICNDGAILMVRCEYGQCRVMR